MTDNETLGEIVSLHEAGHAVACLVGGLPFTFAEIETGFWGRFTGNGRVRTRVPNDTDEIAQRQFRGLIVTYVAGAAAERHYYRTVNGRDYYDENASASDMHEVDLLLPIYRRITLAQAWQEADRLVVQHWGRIQGVAAQLIERKQLSEGQVKRARPVKERAA